MADYTKTRPLAGFRISASLLSNFRPPKVGLVFENEYHFQNALRAKDR